MAEIGFAKIKNKRSRKHPGGPRGHTALSYLFLALNGI